MKAHGKWRYYSPIPVVNFTPPPLCLKGNSHLVAIGKKDGWE
jgi:hypothetical protein